jgi:hypothetical protein
MAFPMLMLAAAGVQAGASILGGIGAKQSAQLNAFNLGTEKRLSQAEAAQRNNDRMELYRSNLSANIASFAAQGRDIGADRSVSAFLDRQREIAVSDTERSNFMAMMEGLKIDSQAAATRQEGRAAMGAGFIDGFTTMASGLHKYGQVK